MDRGSAVQTQLVDSGGPEDKSRQWVVALWAFRVPLVSQAVLVPGPCSTKISHQEQNIVATLKARIVVRGARRYVRHVPVASLLRA